MRHDDAGHDKHAGHDPEMFRRRFWLSLLLTVPVVVTSQMVMEWFGYHARLPGHRPGSARCSARSSSSGAAGRSWPARVGEVRDRTPGMMLLIAMAITVAYVVVAGDQRSAGSTSTSGGSSPRWSTIMLLGHWQEMKAIGQAQGALAALAALLPDEAERVDRRRRSSRSPSPTWRSATSCWSAPAAGSRPTAMIVDGAAELDESMITGESRAGAPRRSATGSSPAPSSTDSSIRVRVDAVGEDTALAGHPAAGRRGPGVAARGPRRWPTGSPRCCSTSPPAPASSRSSSGALLGDARRGGRAHRHRAGDRLPARARPGHPAGHRALDARSPPRPASWSRTAWRWSGCAPSTPSCSTRPAP